MEKSTKGNSAKRVITMRFDSSLYSRVQEMARKQHRKIAPQFEILVERGLLYTQKWPEWTLRRGKNETVQE